MNELTKEQLSYYGLPDKSDLIQYIKDYCRKTHIDFRRELQLNKYRPEIFDADSNGYGIRFNATGIMCLLPARQNGTIAVRSYGFELTEHEYKELADLYMGEPWNRGEPKKRRII